MLVALTRAPCGLTSQLPKERESHFGADHLGATGDVQVLARAVVGVGLERDLSCNARSVQIVASKLASEIGYDAKPVSPAEEVDRLTSVVEQSTAALTSALAQLERVQARNLRSVS